MQSSFLTVCVDCARQIELPRDDVQLVTCAGVTRWSYQCPLCRSHVIRDANPCHLERFAAGGLEPRRVVPPQRPSIEGRPPSGPPLTEDDFLTFGRRLEASS